MGYRNRQANKIQIQERPIDYKYNKGNLNRKTTT